MDESDVDRMRCGYSSLVMRDVFSSSLVPGNGCKAFGRVISKYRWGSRESISKEGRFSVIYLEASVMMTVRARP